MRYLYTIIMLIYATHTLAQDNYGVIKGRISYDNAAVLEANVTAIVEQYVVEDETTSSFDGSFTFKPLYANNYTITVSKDGYKTHVLHNVLLSSRKAVTLHIQLIKQEDTGSNMVIEYYIPPPPPAKPIQSKPEVLERSHQRPPYNRTIVSLQYIPFTQPTYLDKSGVYDQHLNWLYKTNKPIATFKIDGVPYRSDMLINYRDNLEVEFPEPNENTPAKYSNKNGER